VRAENERGFLSWVTRLVREHRTDLVAVARGEGLAPEDALDVTQEALTGFLELPHARKLADELEDSRAFLSVMVRNNARNRRRSHAVSRQHVSEPEVLHQLSDDGESVDALIDRAEQHILALGCVQRLGEVQKKVVTLRLLQDQPGTEVAELLGLSPGNVAVILHRAKSELRACMDDA
jgi:RNA polymerase sigma-70 factor (ECF subfamily)